MSGRSTDLAGFAPALIDWQRRAGRKGLPWQGSRDPYRVWLSEIMLQQTQVSTVIGYYDRFLARFPDVKSLALALEDEVMALWSGLGYYSRARNLLRCARVVVAEHGGEFPRSAALLEQLPGIGASTAAAIAAFCFGERISIVDGNVRRVLGRLLSFKGDLATSSAQRELWDLAQTLLPDDPRADDMVAYTQGLMDLGAGICTRSKPACEACPVSDICSSRAKGTQAHHPVKTRRAMRRHESWWMLVLRVKQATGVQVWLEKRPVPGIWAGLMSVPVFADEASALALVPRGSHRVRHLPAVAHALTHRELRLHPLLIDDVAPESVSTCRMGQWVTVDVLAKVGLPTPVRSLLEQLPD